MVMITEMRELAEAMDAEGAPQPHALYQRPNGQWVADVFPLGLEGILYGGFKGELWMQPGKDPTQVHMRQHPLVLIVSVWTSVSYFGDSLQSIITSFFSQTDDQT